MFDKQPDDLMMYHWTEGRHPEKLTWGPVRNIQHIVDGLKMRRVRHPVVLFRRSQPPFRIGPLNA